MSNPTVKDIVLEYLLANNHKKLRNLLIADGSGRCSIDIDVIEIITDYFQKHGYNGLYCKSCSCFEDIAPCGEDISDCKLGYYHREKNKDYSHGYISGRKRRK